MYMKFKLTIVAIAVIFGIVGVTTSIHGGDQSINHQVQSIHNVWAQHRSNSIAYVRQLEALYSEQRLDFHGLYRRMLAGIDLPEKGGLMINRDAQSIAQMMYPLSVALQAGITSPMLHRFHREFGVLAEARSARSGNHHNAVASWQPLWVLGSMDARTQEARNELVEVVSRVYEPTARRVIASN
jgi:hypothetical protein